MIFSSGTRSSYANPQWRLLVIVWTHVHRRYVIQFLLFLNLLLLNVQEDRMENADSEIKKVRKRGYTVILVLFNPSFCNLRIAHEIH